jgi:F420-0:gamma-glutamyl ligase-like protein
VNSRYKAVAIETQYWKPRHNYIEQIIQAIKNRVEEGDIITISEKAVSIATGNLIDEKKVRPTMLAYFIAKHWMRNVWPHILGPICHLRLKTIEQLHSYPVKEGSKHKQLALDRGGFLQALMLGSEAGIDGSNIPYSYVSLPLENACEIARGIKNQIEIELRKTVTVVVVDTDKTYSLWGFHFTPHPKPIKGIHSVGGVLAYIVGRSLKLKKRATPLAVVGDQYSTEEAIEISRIANRMRGSGSGRTVWDMVQKFNVNFTDVTWKMLGTVKHHPIVIIRSKTQKKK